VLPPRSNGKPEAAAAVDKLLMMGMRMPETCWAVFKRQAINLQNCCIWLVISFEHHIVFLSFVLSSVILEYWSVKCAWYCLLLMYVHAYLVCGHVVRLGTELYSLGLCLIVAGSWNFSFSSSPQWIYWLWGQPSHLFSGYWAFYLEDKAARAWSWPLTFI
jgi:hypothetical protein